MDNPNLLDNTATAQVTLSFTYYEIGNTQPVNNVPGTHLEGPIPINVSYSNFFQSVLRSGGFNTYRSCVFLDVGVGPPALMISVSALTATTTATVKSAGNYGLQSPQSVRVGCSCAGVWGRGVVGVAMRVGVGFGECLVRLYIRVTSVRL